MENIKNKSFLLYNIQFNKLFSAQLLSHFGDAIIQFILIAILIEKLPSAGRAMALTFFSFLLPQFLFSTFAGSLSDKISRKLILSLSCIIRAVTLIIFLININNANTGTIYLVSFILGIGSVLFYPAKMSILPNITENSQLKFANAFTSPTGTIAILFGAFIASFFIEQAGINGAVVIIISLYIAAAILCSLIKLRIKQSYSKFSNGAIENFKTAVRYLKGHKKALYLVILSICLQFIVAAFSNNLNILITDYYNLDFNNLTYLRTLLGAGIIIGLLAAIFLARSLKVIHIFALGFIVFCIALFTAPLCNSLDIAWKWLIPIGIADAFVVIMLDTILQKVTPDRIRGKIFGLNLTLNTLSFLSATLIIALSAGHISPLNTFKIIAVISLILAVSILLFDKSFRYFLLKSTLGLLFKYLFVYKTEGIENIPKTGKVILAGNHTGHLDPFILQMATKRHLWFVTGPAAFKVPVIKYFLKFYNVLPLKFGKGMEAIEAAVTKLKKGEAVIIFPEGRFTPDGDVHKFNRGVGIMAKQANCPIVPFAIKGGFETWNKKRKLPKLFNTIVIQFGQPLTETEKDEKEIALELQTRVNFMKKALDRRAYYNITNELHSNFLDLMQEKGDIYGQNTALSIKTESGYKSYTYIELSRYSKKLANFLIENFNISKGTRIAILCESRPEFSIGLFASIQTGAITVPLDVKLTVSEHTNILNDCNPEILLCSSHYLKHAVEVKNNVHSIKHILLLDKDETVEDNSPAQLGKDFSSQSDSSHYQNIFDIEADIDKDLGIPRSLDETALIVYTSGTTGNPKGVMTTFGNIYSQLRDVEKIFKLSNRNKFLSILPLNHLLELNVGLFAMLYMGTEVTYIKTLSPKELTETMKEKGITNIILVPLVAKMLKNSIDKQIKKQSVKVQKIFKIMYKAAKYMPRKIRRLMFKSIIDGLGGRLEAFISGGAPLEDNIAEFFDRLGIPVFQGYGLTETSPIVATNNYKHHKLGTVGRPLPSVTVKTSETGELIVYGPNVMQGYYGKPELTAEVIDENGWFHTGDIGEIDKDGFIKITGRIKNMIVLGGGKKIFPEEVEAVLEQSDKIKEVCVMSLKITSGNKSGTEEVGAIIVPADNIKNDENVQSLIEKEVKNLSLKFLAPYKKPTVVVIHKEELPKTSTKKVKRKELLEWYENNC